MTMVICPKCQRTLRTVVNQIAYGNNHAILECKPCRKMYKMTLEEVSGTEIDGWIINEVKE